MKKSFLKTKLENFIPPPAISIRMSGSPRKTSFARHMFLLLLAGTWPLAAAFAQSQSLKQSQSSQQSQSQAQSQPQKKDESAADAAKKSEKEKPKPKKVYTEEDLSGMRGGGVSVVGDAAASNSGPTGKKSTNAQTGKNVVPMSGQDEAYWRGKAQPILAQIAAVDEEIAKTKEEIKKYGGDGFDVTSGLKEDIIYIDNRNARVQWLEKRKTDLEKQLDALQEEGRKAGAEPSWFR